MTEKQFAAQMKRFLSQGNGGGSWEKSPARALSEGPGCTGHLFSRHAEQTNAYLINRMFTEEETSRVTGQKKPLGCSGAFTDRDEMARLIQNALQRDENLSGIHRWMESETMDRLKLRIDQTPYVEKQKEKAKNRRRTYQGFGTVFKNRNQTVVPFTEPKDIELVFRKNREVPPFGFEIHTAKLGTHETRSASFTEEHVLSAIRQTDAYKDASEKSDTDRTAWLAWHAYEKPDGARLHRKTDKNGKPCLSLSFPYQGCFCTARFSEDHRTVLFFANDENRNRRKPPGAFEGVGTKMTVDYFLKKLGKAFREMKPDQNPRLFEAFREDLRVPPRDPQKPKRPPYERRAAEKIVREAESIRAGSMSDSSYVPGT